MNLGFSIFFTLKPIFFLVTKISLIHNQCGLWILKMISPAIRFKKTEHLCYFQASAQILAYMLSYSQLFWGWNLLFSLLSVTAIVLSKVGFICAVTEPCVWFECSVVAILKFLRLFEHEAPYFYFDLGPSNSAGCCCPIGISNENKTVGSSNIEYNSKTYCFYYHYPKITGKFP